MRRITMALLAVVLAACSEGGGFGVPPELDDGVMIIVDRTVENELRDSLVEGLEGMGYPEAIAGVYEFDFIPDKPVFFLGAGKGANVDRQRLLDGALAMLAGENGPTEPPTEMSEAGTTFLCAPYSHTGLPGTQGTGGLASMSAVCSWSDQNSGGFGVWIAGASVGDTLKRTAEAREAVG